MTSSVDALTVDCRDPRLLANFWCAALGYRIDDVDDEGAWIRPVSGEGWMLLFQIVPEGKVVKNRLHLDLRPAKSMDEEVARAVSAGATVVRRVDEGGNYWTVMLDPEGNEFCVLRGPDDGWTPGASVDD